MSYPSLRALALVPVVLALAACPAPPKLAPDAGLPDPSAAQRVPGSTDFVSADGYDGQESPDPITDAPAPDDGAEAPGEDERSVEEGDIYRVLEGSLLANLNAYRGLQLIDFSDPSAPSIIGRYPVSGSPVEMYLHEDTAYVLLNDWRGYYGSPYASTVDVWNGGVALAIDVSDPTNPVLIDRAVIPGYLQKSRLVHGGDNAALYVVTGGYDQWQNDDGSWSYESRTVVQSFDVSQRSLVPKTQLNLGGYVRDIQATPEALLVARNDWESGEARSLVSIVDISDPRGAMVEGDQVSVEGYVENQFNLDLYNGVLRVVSGATWSGTRTNHLRTFDATDIHALVPIDHDTFGDDEDLYATLFLGNKAFFVTYFRVDPFHAFEIDDAGNATERSEFVVSGWNDFFRPVLDETRLIGIGVNDEQSRTMAVSLYDITDLDNPSPLLARAEVDADSSWSEASWDHRAFSVLQGVVDVPAGDPGDPDETGGAGEVRETGLVLLPFTGWSAEEERYTAGVQIFTFSESTLTRRGMMMHGTPVRRSFRADADLAANLSEAELSLFDTSVPDAPVEQGRLELAPNYTNILPFGDDFAVRVRNPVVYYGSWAGNSELPPASAEIIPRTGNPDAVAAVATIEIPANATVYKSGDRLVSVHTRVVSSSEWPYTYESDIAVYDLGDPTVPVQTAAFTTDRVQPAYGYYGWDDCFDCGWYGVAASRDAVATDDALAFVRRHGERELLGVEHTCYTYPDEPYGGCSSDSESCSYYTGGISCRSLNGGPELCSGTIQHCTYGPGGTDCVEVDPATIQTRESCYDYDRYRHWQRFTVEVLDLRDESAPAFAASVALPHHQDGVSVVEAGSALWLVLREPVQLPNDPRPYVRYYARKLDLTNPAAPALGPAVNVPGALLAAQGDALFTRDLVWGDETAETWVHRLRLDGDVAVLEASRAYAGRQVRDVRVDDAGHLLVTHGPRYSYGNDSNDEPSSTYHKLAILDVSGAALAPLSEIDVDTWASLQDARAGRALFQVPGGLLVMNLDDATAPYPQAWFPTVGWPHEIVVDGDQILFAAGRYGVYAFPLDAFNLIEGAPL